MNLPDQTVSALLPCLLGTSHTAQHRTLMNIQIMKSVTQVNALFKPLQSGVILTLQMKGRKGVWWGLLKYQEVKRKLLEPVSSLPAKSNSGCNWLLSLLFWILCSLLLLAPPPFSLPAVMGISMSPLLSPQIRVSGFFLPPKPFSSYLNPKPNFSSCCAAASS